jgi:hypothetical protein
VTPSQLDVAVLAHRQDPTPATRAALMAAQAAHADAFMRAQTQDYQARTHAPVPTIPSTPPTE